MSGHWILSVSTRTVKAEGSARPALKGIIKVGQVNLLPLLWLLLLVLVLVGQTFLEVGAPTRASASEEK